MKFNDTIPFIFDNSINKKFILFFVIIYFQIKYKNYINSYNIQLNESYKMNLKNYDISFNNNINKKIKIGIISHCIKNGGRARITSLLNLLYLLRR
jgi:hypothetical protein